MRKQPRGLPEELQRHPMGGYEKRLGEAKRRQHRARWELGRPREDH